MLCYKFRKYGHERNSNFGGLKKEKIISDCQEDEKLLSEI